MSDETDWDEWLEAIENDGVNLTVWEEDFVQSVKAQRENDRPLSSKQAEILERIYAAKTP